MKNFIKGSLFALVVIPLIECGVQITQQLTGHICTAIAAQTYKINKDLPKESEDSDCKESTFAIGFHMPEKEEQYEDDEDDE